MKTIVGVYNSHKEALAAVTELQKADFPVKQLSIIGQAEIVEDHLQVKSKEAMKVAGVGVGAVIGPVLGVLSGVGIIAIPGLGFLYGIGAVAGAIAGFDIGLIGGTVVSVLTMLGIKDDNEVKYEEHLKEGHFLVIAHGSEEDIEKAHKVLETHTVHNENELAHH